VLDAQRLSVEDVRELLIEVPTAYARMIDHPLPPASRQESISDVRYQVALAALKPDQLYDVAHTIIHTDRQILDVMHRIRVQTDPALDAQYPDAWPARVTLTTHSGATLTREQVRVPGDPGTGFGWPDVRSKLLRMGLSADLESRIEQPCKNLGHGALPALLAALEA
jgi:2-methylcitrate dehydratase PrpD